MMENSLFSQIVFSHIIGTGIVEACEYILRNAVLEYRVRDYRPSAELHLFSADCTDTGAQPTDYYVFRNRLSDYPKILLTETSYRRVRNLPFAL